MFMVGIMCGRFCAIQPFWLKGLRERPRSRKRGPLCAAENAARPILVTVLGMVAEMERKFIRERQQAGIEAAKAKGIYKGRKPSVPVEKVREMRANGHGATAIAKALGVRRMSVHCVLSGQV